MEQKEEVTHAKVTEIIGKTGTSRFGALGAYRCALVFRLARRNHAGEGRFRSQPEPLAYSQCEGPREEGRHPRAARVRTRSTPPSLNRFLDNRSRSLLDFALS